MPAPGRRGRLETPARSDVDALLDYRGRAPGASLARPTQELFLPVVVAAGAACGEPGGMKFPITGLANGPFTQRSVEFS